MGRKKKDHKFHLLQGTDRGQGALKSLPAPATTRWNVPSWVGKWGKEYHKAHWDYALAMGMLTECDRASWWSLCQRWHRIRECEQAIDEHGPVVQGRQGELKRNPAAASLKAELAAFRLERGTFGLDPESRLKLGIKVHKESAMSKLIDPPGGIWVD